MTGLQPIRWLMLTGILAAAAGAQDENVRMGHPRLLIGSADVDAIRVRCGREGYRDNPAARIKGVVFGSQRDLLERLRLAAGTIMEGLSGPDDLYAPAMMHLVSGELGRPDEYTRYVAARLLDPARRQYEFDALVALDYCWAAIEQEKRERILNRLLAGLEPLELSQNPLIHRTFYRKLCSLAAAFVVHDDPAARTDPRDARNVALVIARGKHYLEDIFPRLCRARGAMPSSSESGISEEADLVLAAEIYRSAARRSLWPELSDSLGRAMEHYFYADTGHAALGHGFLHDDGSFSPAAPARQYQGFLPAVPWAIARYTRDPVATWYANRAGLLATTSNSVAVDRYLWIPLVYGPLEQPEAARRAMPLGRDLGGGWVVMRSGWEGGDTILLFDAGQPRWRSRQHFDAGQFQIHRKGRLAIDSGDDVALQAVVGKGGNALIAGQPGDWDQYAQSTIAHNCVTVADPNLAMEMHGRLWPALGNQRLVEGDYNPGLSIAEQDRHKTGRLTCFATNTFFSYAAADLTAAYPPGLVKSLAREVLFVHAGAVLVLDRLIATAQKSAKTWHLQMPARPALFGEKGTAALSVARQLHGVDHDAGIWELGAEHPWLVITNGEGRLFVRTLLPEAANRRVVGGPMRPMQVKGGAYQGLTYYGGDPLGYEHRLWPASFLRAPNAAYVLGEPTSLGPQFGAGATWGRCDISPAQVAREVLFLHLLIPTDAGTAEPPRVGFRAEADQAVVDLELNNERASIAWGLGEGTINVIRISEATSDKVLFEGPLCAEKAQSSTAPQAETDAKPR